MLLEESAHAIGVDDYGLKVGDEGMVVVHACETPFDTLRTREPRSLVVKDGVPVAESDRTTTVYASSDRPIDFTDR